MKEANVSSMIFIKVSLRSFVMSPEDLERKTGSFIETIKFMDASWKTYVFLYFEEQSRSFIQDMYHEVFKEFCQ